MKFFHTLTIFAFIAFAALTTETLFASVPQEEDLTAEEVEEIVGEAEEAVAEALEVLQEEMGLEDPDLEKIAVALENLDLALTNAVVARDLLDSLDSGAEMDMLAFALAVYDCQTIAEQILIFVDQIRTDNLASALTTLASTREMFNELPEASSSIPTALNQNQIEEVEEAMLAASLMLLEGAQTAAGATAEADTESAPRPLVLYQASSTQTIIETPSERTVSEEPEDATQRIVITQDIAESTSASPN